MPTPWWKNGIVYQIYPRSYQDSNGDGVGDLRGITKRLDYITSLNVEAIWISPIYPSPMRDFGYDVSDYKGIHPLFGDMRDFDELLHEAHQRGLKVILDFVPNHTSDEHPWFEESKRSIDNPKRDYYIWKDPAADGGPPNNWLSFFGGPAWTYDEHTGQYYLHQFLPSQPELNYSNPEVVQGMFDNIRFWLDRGVDGFRVDVIWCMVKDALMRDEPDNPAWDGIEKHLSLQHIHTQDVPGIHELVKKMRGVFDGYDDRLMIGEIYLPIKKLVNYYGERNDECHLPFNFVLLRNPWNADKVRDLITEYEAALPDGAWPNWVLGNHDNHRIASRVGVHQARMANLMLLTIRGTPTCYYGDELGMEDVPVPYELMRDPFGINNPEQAHIFGRDPERSPMLWDSSANSGFANDGVVPWLPVTPNHEQVCVEAQKKDPASMLHLFKSLTAMRSSEPALSLGSIDIVRTGNPDIDSHVLCYTRRPDYSQMDECLDGADIAPTTTYDSFLVVLNFESKGCVIDLTSTVDASYANVAIATDMKRQGKVDLSQIELNPDEGLLLRLCHDVQTQ